MIFIATGQWSFFIAYCEHRKDKDNHLKVNLENEGKHTRASFGAKNFLSNSTVSSRIYKIREDRREQLLWINENRIFANQFNKSTDITKMAHLLAYVYDNDIH